MTAFRCVANMMESSRLNRAALLAMNDDDDDEEDDDVAVVAFVKSVINGLEPCRSSLCMVPSRGGGCPCLEAATAATASF